MKKTMKSDPIYFRQVYFVLIMSVLLIFMHPLMHVLSDHGLFSRAVSNGIAWAVIVGTCCALCVRKVLNRVSIALARFLPTPK